MSWSPDTPQGKHLDRKSDNNHDDWVDAPQPHMAEDIVLQGEMQTGSTDEHQQESRAPTRRLSLSRTRSRSRRSSLSAIQSSASISSSISHLSKLQRAVNRQILAARFINSTESIATFDLDNLSDNELDDAFADQILGGSHIPSVTSSPTTTERSIQSVRVSQSLNSTKPETIEVTESAVTTPSPQSRRKSSLVQTTAAPQPENPNEMSTTAMLRILMGQKKKSDPRLRVKKRTLRGADKFRSLVRSEIMARDFIGRAHDLASFDVDEMTDNLADVDDLEKELAEFSDLSNESL